MSDITISERAEIKLKRNLKKEQKERAKTERLLKKENRVARKYLYFKYCQYRTCFPEQ
jgi:hypothetical protein